MIIPFQTRAVSDNPSDPRDNLNRDQLLVMWQDAKDKLASIKEHEIELRKYIISRAFPEKREGMNTEELGNGYQLKASIKFNYNLINDNDKIFDAQDRISKIGNKGAFIAERLFSWKASFLLKEYRELMDEKDESKEAQEILKIISEVLVIEDAAPSLEIKGPKK